MFDSISIIVFIYLIIVTTCFMSLVAYIIMYSFKKISKYKNQIRYLDTILDIHQKQVHNNSEELKHLYNNLSTLRGQIVNIVKGLELLNKEVNK
jgi:predicted PurR-regulated permease PerM